MADFNPDQYLQEKSALVAQNAQPQAFDPDQYLKEKGADFGPTMSQGHAARLGAEQGFTFGLRPFAAGVGAGAGSAAGTFTNQRSSGKGLLESAKAAYEAGKTGFSEGRQEANQEQESAAAQYPKTYYGSMIGGGLLTAPLTPVRSIGQAAKLGAGLGAANALSTANSVTEGAKDVAEGAAGGAILHGATSGVIKGIQSLSNASSGAKNLAAEIAFKALGPSQRDVISNQERIGQIGNTLMKEGVVGGGTTNYEGLANRANQALEQKGQKFESMLNDISDAAEKQAQSGGSSANLPSVPGQAAPKAGISTQEIGLQLKKELQANTRLPGGQDTNDAVNKYVNEFIENNPKLISIKDAQKLKTELGSNINWQRDPRADIPQSEQFDRALYHSLNKGVEDAADASAPLLGKNALSQWKQVKEEYGALKAASMIANRKAGRDFANRFISPSDYFTAFEGANHVKGDITEKTATGIALGIVNHLARTRGAQVIAPALQGAGNAAQKVQPALNAVGLLGKGAGALNPYIQMGAQRGLIQGSQ